MSDKKDDVVAKQHEMIGNMFCDPSANFKRTKHPDAQWFPEAGLGLFLHFGISSVSGECDLSWGMMKPDRIGWSRQIAIERFGLFNMSVCIPPSRYWAMAKDFKADRFNPEKFLSAAKKAGFQYAVLTTKHHDGFALWPSKVGDFNIGIYQPGRDLVREFTEGCRKTGIKAGLYYSPPDWYFNRDLMSFNKGQDKIPLDIHHRPFKLPERSPEEIAAWEEKNRAYVKAQTEELLTNYGKIDILWFDGSADNAISVERIRELQPGILINTRGLGVGDFKTPECKFPEKAQVKDWWWEYCHVGYDGGWGYRNHDGYKPAGWILSEFVKARAWGGNFLPNYGPDSHGELPEVFYKRMEQIAKWREKHEESVSGVEPGPWPEQSDMPVTVKGDTWYVFFDYLNDGWATLKDVKKPLEARLLLTGEAVPFEYGAGTLKIMLPEEMRTTLVDVVAVKFR
jgi:alpha-L-fucosidase